MNFAPVRRIVAACGLIALVPIALRLYSGVLTPLEAATRALLVFTVVMTLTRLAGWGLLRVLEAVERHDESRRRELAAELLMDGRGIQEPES